MFLCCFFMAAWDPHKLHCIGKLAWPLPSRFIYSFLKEGVAPVFLSISPISISPPIKQPYSLHLLKPRSFLQQYMPVLDVCAGTMRVGKVLSVLWVGFVRLELRSILPVITEIGDSINHTINPIGVDEHGKCSSGPRTSSLYWLLDADNCRFVNFPSYHHEHVVVLQLLVVFSFHWHHL